MFPVVRNRRPAPTSGRAEDGSALLSVIGLMAVLAIIAVAISGATVRGLGYSTATRAGVQAQSAALAGVDAVQAAMSGGTCAGSYASSLTPQYSAIVKYSASTDPSPSLASFSTGCPGSSARYVMIQSTGYAAAPGGAGFSGQNAATVQAIFTYTSAASAIAGTGSAIYSYGSSNNLNSISVVPDGTIDANIVIYNQNGTLTCQNSTINGNVILSQGNFSPSGGCVVTGSVSVAGTVAMTSGALIKGNVSAGAASSPSVSVEQGTTVQGNVVAGGPVRVAGTVQGNVTAGPGTGTSTFTSGSKVNGKIVVSGDISADGAVRCPSPATWNNAGDACAIVQRGTTPTLPVYQVPGIVAPQAPSVPAWSHYSSPISDWTSLGYRLVTWSSSATGDCNIGSWNASYFTSALTSTVPTVIDATACSQVTLQLGGSLKLSSDIAIIARGFSLGPGNYDSADGSARSLRLIVPDNGAAGSAPSCPYTGNACHVNIYGALTMTSKIAAIVYTPGAIDNTNTTWRGQLYGKNVNTGQNITLTYLPVGIPSINLDTGSSIPAGPTSGVIGTRVSIRDTNGG